MTYTPIPIHSANATFQKIEVLKRNRIKRQKRKKFFVEGVRNINEAVKNRWKIDAFCYAKNRKLSRWAEGILNKNLVKNVYEVPLKLMQKLSEKENTSELVAVIEMPDDDFKRIEFSSKKPPLIVVIDRPSNRGNLGTIIRSCDVMGVDGIIITGHCVDLYDPEVIVASMGSFFAIPIIRAESHKEVLRYSSTLKVIHKDLQIVGTSAKTEKSIYDSDFKKPTILLIGNETHGLSRAYKEMSDVLYKIPMTGSASSLNIACATSVLLYEAGRQRLI